MPRNDKIDVDLSVLADFSNEQVGKIPLKRAIASGKFAQVGINLFRNQDNNTIWQLQSSDEGEFIIRAEPAEEQHTVVESSQDGQWTAIPDSSKQNVTLSRHGIPLCRFASSEFGFDADSVEAFQKYLIEQTESKGFGDAVEAYSTGKCPLCHEAITSIGINRVVCANKACPHCNGKCSGCGVVVPQGEMCGNKCKKCENESAK